MVKQESQRRLRSAELPARSFASPTAGAEAGRAHQRAVAAGQAALRHVIPTRVFQIGQQQFAHIVGAHMPTHVGACARAIVPSAMRHVSACVAGRCGNRASRAAPRSLPTSTRNSCDLPKQFGQREVEPARAFGPVFIEAQKQVPPACAAVHRDDEHALPPRLVMRIDIAALPGEPGPGWRWRATRRTAPQGTLALRRLRRRR